MNSKSQNLFETSLVLTTASLKIICKTCGGGCWDILLAFTQTTYIKKTKNYIHRLFSCLSRFYGSLVIPK